jgi:hypothetical protein
MGGTPLGDVEECDTLLRVLPNHWGQQSGVRSDVQARLGYGLASASVDRPSTQRRPPTP